MIIIRAEDIDMNITLPEDVVITPSVIQQGVYFIFRPNGKEVKIDLKNKTTSAELYLHELKFLLYSKLIAYKNELSFKPLIHE